MRDVKLLPGSGPGPGISAHIFICTRSDQLIRYRLDFKHVCFCAVLVATIFFSRDFFDGLLKLLQAPSQPRVTPAKDGHPPKRPCTSRLICHRFPRRRKDRTTSILDPDIPGSTCLVCCLSSLFGGRSGRRCNSCGREGGDIPKSSRLPHENPNAFMGSVSKLLTC